MLAREGARVLLVDLYPERAAETLEIIENEGGEAARRHLGPWLRGHGPRRD